ncbi:MAG: PqqD family protein [Alistipes sp.]|nr:PqqD family protein [Alistipes sp.]
MKFKVGYKVRSMAGENVVIMQGTAGSDMTRIISLNDSSLLLWNELQGKEFEVEDVANVLVDTYEIDAALAERDAKAWIERLRECNLIEE